MEGIGLSNMLGAGQLEKLFGQPQETNSEASEQEEQNLTFLKAQ